MSYLAPLPRAHQDWILRELRRAQMIVASPHGTWPESLIDLSHRVLRQWPGWNVRALPQRPVALGARHQANPRATGHEGAR